MSLVQGLAVRVTSVGEELPIRQVAAAADRLRTATGLLAATLRASADAPPTPLLVAAGDHLEHAAGAMRRARDELDHYLAAAVGVTTGEHFTPLTVHPSDSSPIGKFTDRSDLWTERVDHLTGLRGTPVPERIESTVEELLRDVVRRTRAGDRTGLRDRLAAAPAATGLALAPLAADLLRRADTPAAPPARLRDLLPHLDPLTPLEILARAARRPVPPRDPEVDGPAHPVDPAVAGPVLLALLIADEKATTDA